MRVRSLLFAIAAMMTAAVTPAEAQVCNTTGAGPTSCTINTTTSLTIPVILRMTVGTTTTSFGTLTSTDYDNGQKTLGGPTITVKANQTWQVQMASSATFWTGAGGARANKPLADLQWGATSNGSFTAVTGTGTQIGSGSGTGGTVVPLFLRSLWNYATDSPGTYSVVVNFTLVSP